MMLTKTQAIGINYFILALVAISLILTNINSYGLNECSNDVTDLFMNRSNLEYKSLMDLSDRNVLVLESLSDMIRNETEYAKQNYEKAKEELRHVYNFENDMYKINKNIALVKKNCNGYIFQIQIYSSLASIFIIIQFLVSLVIISRTRWDTK